MPSTPTRFPSSPRLRALHRQLTVGDPVALAGFWDEVAAQGTPLIEPLRGGADHCLVTFLYRGDDDVRSVVVQEGGSTAIGGILPAELHQIRLRPLAGTDIWHRSYRLPANVRLTYSFSVNDALVPLERLTPQQAAARMAALQPDPLNRTPWLDGLAGNRSSVVLARAEPWP